MPVEPPAKRTCIFIDGQNLFHAAKDAFGHRYPNYDVLKLAKARIEACPRSSTLHRTLRHTQRQLAND